MEGNGNDNGNEIAPGTNIPAFQYLIREKDTSLKEIFQFAQEVVGNEEKNLERFFQLYRQVFMTLACESKNSKNASSCSFQDEQDQDFVFVFSEDEKEKENGMEMETSIRKFREIFRARFRKLVYLTKVQFDETWDKVVKANAHSLFLEGETKTEVRAALEEEKGWIWRINEQRKEKVFGEMMKEQVKSFRDVAAKQFPLLVEKYKKPGDEDQEHEEMQFYEETTLSSKLEQMMAEAVKKWRQEEDICADDEDSNEEALEAIKKMKRNLQHCANGLIETNRSNKLRAESFMTKLVHDSVEIYKTRMTTHLQEFPVMKSEALGKFHEQLKAELLQGFIDNSGTKFESTRFQAEFVDVLCNGILEAFEHLVTSGSASAKLCLEDCETRCEPHLEQFAHRLVDIFQSCGVGRDSEVGVGEFLQKQLRINLQDMIESFGSQSIASSSQVEQLLEMVKPRVPKATEALPEGDTKNATSTSTSKTPEPEPKPKVQQPHMKPLFKTIVDEYTSEMKTFLEKNPFAEMSKLEEKHDFCKYIIKGKYKSSLTDVHFNIFDDYDSLEELDNVLNGVYWTSFESKQKLKLDNLVKTRKVIQSEVMMSPGESVLKKQRNRGLSRLAPAAAQKPNLNCRAFTGKNISSRKKSNLSKSVSFYTDMDYYGMDSKSDSCPIEKWLSRSFEN